jgi:hypothetical protein
MKSIAEILSGSTDIASVELACQLAVDSSNSVFLCDSFEEGVRGQAVYVENSQLLVDQMDGVIPPYGGSSCLYCESCRAIGRLHRELDGSIWIKLDHCVLELEDGENVNLETAGQKT